MQNQSGKMITAFTNANLLDGTGKILKEATVLIKENQIIEVGSTIDVPKGSKIYDVKGMTLMPGMIDAHVHICFNGDPSPLTSLNYQPGLIQLFGAYNAIKTLEAGFTTIRDMGAPQGFAIALKKGIEMRITRGPRILAPGRIISQTGGHADFHMPSGVSYNELSLISDGPQETRKSARINLRDGADFIKICSSGGVMSPTDPVDTPQFTIDEIKSVTEEAAALNKIVASHAHGPTGIMNAVLAGVKSIEHGSIQTKDTVKAMSESGVFHIPTLKAAWGIIQAGDSAGIPEYAMAKAKEMGEYPSKSLILSFRAGVKVASGTDAGTPFNRHGDNAKELELMVDAGLTPMDAIVCTTKNGAEVCGLSKRLGTIETGKLADIIVVNGDPSKEIRLLQNKQNIMLVMKDGIIEVNRGL